MKDLMKPRVIVENYYPNSPFKIGDILYRDYATSWLTEESHEIFTINETYLRVVKASEVEMSTTIFRRLDWWEHRDVSEMPMYVKLLAITDKIEQYGIIKVIQWHLSAIDGMYAVLPTKPYQHKKYYTDKHLTTSVSDRFHVQNLLPATEQEYNDYLTSKSNQ